MRKCFFILMSLMAFFTYGFCNDQCCWNQLGNFDSCCTTVPPTIEFKAGYFFFSNSRMRRIYDDGGYEIQFSGSYPVSDCDSWSWLQTYGSIGYQESFGRSLGGHQGTTLSKVPLNIGLRSIFALCSGMQYYLAVGPRFFFLHQHNNSSFVNRNINHDGVGAFVNTGFRYFAICNLFVDVFGEYSYEHMHFHSHKPFVYDRSIQVGGFSFGAGLGYAF